MQFGDSLQARFHEVFGVFYFCSLLCQSTMIKRLTRERCIYPVAQYHTITQIGIVRAYRVRYIMIRVLCLLSVAKLMYVTESACA